MKQHVIVKVWMDSDSLWVETQDGLRVSSPFAKWERLANASQAEREDFYLSPCGIHWPQVDEDLCFEGLLADGGLCYAAP